MLETQSITNISSTSTSSKTSTVSSQLPTLKGTLLKKNDSNQWSKRICETQGPFLGLLNTKNKLVANLYCPTIQEVTIIGDVKDELGSGTLFNIKLKDEKIWMFRARSIADANKWRDHLLSLSAVNENEINNNVDPNLACRWTTSFSESKGTSVMKSIHSTPLLANDNITQSIQSSLVESPPPPPPPAAVNQALFHNIEKLVIDIDKANSQLENKIQENIKINKLCNVLQLQIDDITKRLEKETKSKEFIQLQLDTKSKEVNSLVMKDDKVNKELEKITTELKNKDQELLKISDLHAGLKIQIEELNLIKVSDHKVKETLQCKLELKSKELASCLQKLKSLQSDLEKNKVELSKLLACSSEYESNIAKLNHLNSELTSTKSHIETQLEIATEKIALLEDIMQKQAVTQTALEKKLKLAEDEKLLALAAQKISEDRFENEKKCREKVEKEKIINDYDTQVY